MEKDEILKIKTEETSLVIIEGGLYIGSTDDDSQDEDVLFQAANGQVQINKWKLSKNQLKTLKKYLNEKI